jgi:4-alpha-glucanotransferase
MLHHNLPLNRFIAEDLGILNSEVCSFRDKFGFPGMIVLQFCFEESVPDVSQYPKDRFIYTGTHDNPTVLEWYLNLEPNSESRMNLQRFVEENPAMFSGLGITNPEDLSDSIHLVMMIIASASGCENVIFPLQDVLGMDSTSRMNVPGTALGNWQWRLVDFSGVAEALADIASHIK